MKCLGFQVVLLAVLCFPSLLCFSSSRCLCSVAASMSPAFSAAVTCCHSLLSNIVTRQGKDTRNTWFTDRRMNTAHNPSVWKESCLEGVWLIWLNDFFHAYIWLWNNTPQIKRCLHFCNMGNYFTSHSNCFLSRISCKTLLFDQGCYV